MRGETIRNYLFHRVSPEPDALWPPMHPKLFERIIRYLVTHTQVVSLEEYLVQPNAGSASKKPLSTVLFDDGYLDNLGYAAPILQRYNCPASFYVVTDCVTNNKPTWTYAIDYTLQHTKIGTLGVELEGLLPSHLKAPELASKQLRITFAKKLKPALKQMNNANRLAFMAAFERNFADVILPRIFLNWEQVRQLDAAGFTIGSHTCTHPLLASMQNEGAILQELNESYNIISKQVGKPPLTISYPVGSYDDRVIRLAKDSGYAFGLAVKQRFYQPLQDDIMAIPRVELYNENWPKTHLRITGLMNTVKSWLRYGR